MKTFASIFKFDFRENNDDTIVPRMKIVLKNIKNLLREYRHCLKGNQTQINKPFLRYFQLREISPCNYVTPGL